MGKNVVLNNDECFTCKLYSFEKNNTIISIALTHKVKMNLSQ